METQQITLLPDFIIIGAGKAGTTSLYHYLDQHQDIFMSKVKEPNFFALEGEHLDHQKEDPKQLNHYPWAVTDLQQYCDLFKDASPTQSKGEASTMYLYSKKAAEGIQNRCPEAKLMVVLRQPAERLYSRYLHLARENRTPTDDFADVLKKDNIYWERQDLVPSGFYADHLSYYFNRFDRNQIMVIFHEELLNNPHKVMEQVNDFLNLSPYNYDYNKKFNKSGYIKNKKLDKLFGQNSVVKSSLKKAAPAVFRFIKKQRIVKKFVGDLRDNNLHRPKLDKSLKMQITNDIYREDIDKLEQLLNINLDHWKQF